MKISSLFVNAYKNIQQGSLFFITIKITSIAGQWPQMPTHIHMPIGLKADTLFL